MNLFTRKTITAAVGALTVAATIVATAAPAEAQWRGRGGYGWRGPALVGGLALGALAAGAYAAPAYGYGGCYITRRPVVNRWGDVVAYRRVRVCE
jgi:hypothetical protein